MPAVLFRIHSTSPSTYFPVNPQMMIGQKCSAKPFIIGIFFSWDKQWHFNILSRTRSLPPADCSLEPPDEILIWMASGKPMPRGTLTGLEVCRTA
jgi:hypothetical protein